MSALRVRRLWVAGAGFVALTVGLVLALDVVGRETEGVYDTVRVLIESLGLTGDTGFRLQGLIGTVLFVVGLVAMVWGTTQAVNAAREDSGPAT